MFTKIKKCMVLSACIGSIPGIAMAVFSMYAALQHNPQRSIHDLQSGYIDIPYWFGIGLSWFLLVGGGIACCVFLVCAFFSALRHVVYKI